MCGCRSPLRRACPPPPHINKAFDLRWYKVARRGGEGVGSGGMQEGHFERPRSTERVRWGLVPPKKKICVTKWH